jgi:hypothetical protein
LRAAFLAKTIIMHKRIYRFPVFLIIVLLAISVFGCKSKKQAARSQGDLTMVQSEEEQAKTEEEAYEEELKEYEKAVNEHYARQTPETRQMMRNTNRNANNVNWGMGRTWDERLFNSSCFKQSCFVKSGHSFFLITDSKRVHDSQFLKQ